MLRIVGKTHPLSVLLVKRNGLFQLGFYNKTANNPKPTNPNQSNKPTFSKFQLKGGQTRQKR